MCIGNHLSLDNNLLLALEQLDNENRIITTPWSRIVRGLGLGQYPINYNETISSWVQDAFDMLKTKSKYQNNYIRFSSLLCDFICLQVSPCEKLNEKDKFYCICNILSLINNEADPYRRVMQYSIAIDALAKLDINLFDIMEERINLAEEIFNTIEKIEANAIKDENNGKHGDYEKLSAYTSIFFSLASCGKRQFAITREQNHISNALKTLYSIPSPFFRGRGGSMLFNAISVLGYSNMLYGNGHDYITELLGYLDKAYEINIYPSFPQPMTPEFVKIYPLLTLLNAIAVTRHKQALYYQRDRIAQASELLEALTPVEQTHMGLYYIMALYNLGLIGGGKYCVNSLVDKLAQTANKIDPSENYFLHGISCSYVIETAIITGKKDIITDSLITTLANSFSTMDKTPEDEINRPYPFAYALTMLGEIEHVDKLFEPSMHYGGQSATHWIINNLSHISDDNDCRLYMFNHALINLMLRMRGNKSSTLKAYSDFTF